MKRTIVFFLAYFSLAVTFAQYKETRKIANHHGISVATSLNAAYVESDRNEIVLESEKKNYLDLIITEIKNDVLTIRYKPNTSIRTSKPNKVTIYSNSKLKVLKATSSATLHVDAPITSSPVSIVANSSGKISARHIKADNMDIEVTSSGKFDSHILASTAVIEASSSGKISLAGKIDNSTIDMSSSASLDLEKVTIKNLVCKGSSSAKLDISTANTLKSNLSSSAKISYATQPTQILENKTSSSGRLVKKS